MIQGEFIFTYRLVTKLKQVGIKAVAGCSDRKVIEKIDEKGNTVKQAVFEFIGFKEY